MWNDSRQSGEPRLVVANGLNQNVLVAGSPSAARTVLLIHGLGWDHALWHGQIDPLVQRGWRVVASDLRGMGATAKPSAPWSLDDYVADLLALTDKLAVGRFAVVGFSLGGMIAAAIASAHQDRVSALVIAAAAVSSSVEGEARTEAMLERAVRLGPVAFAGEQARAIWHRDWAARHPEYVERFVQWRAAMDQAALFRAFRSSYGVDLRPALPSLRMPVCVIAADCDPFASVEMLRGAAQLIPGADFAVIEGAGHMIPVERPEEFAACLLRFLEPHAD